jgi:hypothetical protein
MTCRWLKSITILSNEDTVLVVPAPGVLGNDTDIDGDNSYRALFNDVDHGVLTLNADGSFTYVNRRLILPIWTHFLHCPCGQGESSRTIVKITVRR